MPSAIETLHPDVFVIEQGSVPRIVGVGVNTAGFVGVAEKGPIDEAVFITSREQFAERFGSRFAGSYLEPSVRYFFQQGGTRCWISRAVGSGSGQSETTLKNFGSAPASAAITSGNAETFNLQPAEHVDVSVNGAGATVVTFDAAQAVVTGGSFIGTDVEGLTLIVIMNNGDTQTITFTGLPASPTVEEVAQYINENLLYGSALVDGGGDLDLYSDQFGTGSKVDITGGTALTSIGHGVGSQTGTGDVADIEAVTAAEAAALIATDVGVAITGVVVAGKIVLATVATGATETIQVTVATTATAFGFGNLVHTGDDAGFEDTLTIKAENPGTWGDNVSIRTTKWSTTLDVAPIVNTDTEFRVSSIRDIQKGDIVKVDHPVLDEYYVGIIWDVVVATKTLKVIPLVGGVTSIPTGAVVRSSSTHRLNTTSAVALVTGATELLLTTTFGLREGARVTITDGTTLTDVEITAIDGFTIRFAAVAIGSTIPSGSLVTSQEFDLKVFEKGLLVEHHVLLSMEAASSDYVQTRLFGQTSESLVIEAEDELASPTDDWKNVPLPVDNQALAGGSNGITAVDDDYIGSDVDPKSGMFLFDQVIDLNFIAIPGITTVTVHAAMDAYVQERGTLMAIVDSPEWADRPTEIYNYRMFDWNPDTSYTAMYWPWVEVRDPFIANATTFVPPSGHIAGQYAETAATRGVHVAPANVTLRNVIGLQYNSSDGDQDLLNPVGINAIREFPGEGIRIWGCRTLFSLQDGRHYVNVRRTLNFVKESLKRGNRWAVMQPNDPRLWNQIERTNGEFFFSMWQRGMLFPSDDVSQAYFVKCDAELNPASERKAGRVNTEVGVNVPFPAEFVIFRLSLWDGGSSITEEIARRG